MRFFAECCVHNSNCQQTIEDFPFPGWILTVREACRRAETAAGTLV